MDMIPKGTEVQQTLFLPIKQAGEVVHGFYSAQYNYFIVSGKLMKFIETHYNLTKQTTQFGIRTVRVGEPKHDLTGFTHPFSLAAIDRTREASGLCTEEPDSPISYNRTVDEGGL